MWNMENIFEGIKEANWRVRGFHIKEFKLNMTITLVSISNIYGILDS